jgi:hypothetical protein
LRGHGDGERRVHPGFEGVQLDIAREKVSVNLSHG